MRASVPSRWTRTILICGKCSKKVGGGFGAKGKTGLARALRDLAGLGKGRKATAGVIEVGCLKVCPKGRVVAIDAARPGDWHLIKPGAPIDAVLDTLELS